MEYKYFKNFMAMNHSELFESERDQKEINEIILKGVYSDPNDHNSKTRDLVRKYKFRYLQSLKKATKPTELKIKQQQDSKPIKPQTEKKDSTESILATIKELVELVKKQQQDIESLKPKNIGHDVNAVYNYSEIEKTINEIDFGETKRETFHLSLELVDKINQYHHLARVNKSSLINYIISQFFQNF